MINIEKFAGLVTNASPYALPPGAAVTQVNVQCLSPGQLNVRPGLQAYTLSSTVSATLPVVASFSFPHSGGSIIVYQDAVGNIFSGKPTQSSGGPSLTGVPSAPLNITATASNASATVAWDSPTFTGGGDITGYTVQRSTDGGTTWTYALSATAQSATVTGLTNGVAYVFRAAATNNYGIGPYSSATSSVTPVGAPDSPSSLSATAANSGASLSWTVPTNNGGTAITDYVVEYSGNAGQTWTVFADGTSTATSTNVSGLTNGQAYVFRVAAKNSAGTSAYTTYLTPVYPIGVPDQVASLTATYGNTQVQLQWQAPAANNVSGLTDYTIQRSVDSGATWTTLSDGTNTNTNYTVTGLTNGTAYQFRVSASNSVGAGPYSVSTGNVTPRTLAGAPTNLTVSVGNTQAALSWTAPASTGGAAITDYQIQVSVAGGAYSTITKSASTTTSYTATGLTNGTAYTFRVATVNSEGASAYVTSSSVTPQTVPLAPTSVIGTANNAYVTVRWTAPSDSGGSVITDYVVQYSSNAGSTWTTFTDGTSTVLQTNVTGLTNGTSYIFRVAAVSAVGTGNYSTVSAAVTPVGPPGAPINALVSGGNTQMFTNWTAPSDDGGSAVTGYVLQYRRSTTSSYTTYGTVGNVLEYTISGLTNGYTYYFRVAAVNSVGTGSYSTESASVVVGQVPAAVGTPTLSAGYATSLTDTTLTLSWTAPNSYGSRITDYLIQYGTSSSGPWTVYAETTSTTTTATITGLNATTTYYYRVAAISTVGTGPYSTSPASGRIATAPSITSALTATASDGTVTLSWTTQNDGGAAISGASVWYGYYISGVWTGNATANQIPNALLDLSARTITVPACYGGESQGRWNVSLTNFAGTGSSTVSSALSTPFASGSTGPHTVTETLTLDGNVALTVNLPTKGCPTVSYIDGQYSLDSGATWTAITKRGSSFAAYPTAPSAVTWTPYYTGRSRYWISPPPSSPFSVRTRLMDSSGTALNDYVTTSGISTGSTSDPYWSRVCFLWDANSQRLVTRASDSSLTSSTLSLGDTAASSDRFGRSWKYGYVDFAYNLTTGASAPSDVSKVSAQCVEWWMFIPDTGTNDDVMQVQSGSFSAGSSFVSSVMKVALVSGDLVFTRIASTAVFATSNPYITSTVSLSSLRGQWAHIAMELYPSNGSGGYTVFINGAQASFKSGFSSGAGDGTTSYPSSAQSFASFRIPLLRVTALGRYWVPFQTPNSPFWYPTV